MDRPPPSVPARVLMVLGSLKLTVALLGMSIFLVFAGTLAQVEKGNWAVVDQCFRCWVARIPVGPLLPASWNAQGSFWFPGGWLLGTVLLVNLLISHARRIRVKARGGALAMGLAVLAIGVVMTTIAITHVFDTDSSEKKIEPFWRVTLQLLQGGGAAIVLFAGCWLVFRQKAGIVLLHSGIIVFMMSELSTGLLAEEGNMSIMEGQTVNFVEDTRKVELAIIDPSDATTDLVTAIPESRLRAGGRIELPGLPFNAQVVEPGFMTNSTLRGARDGEVNPASQGVGLGRIAKEATEASGVDSNARDFPAVYVRFREEKGGRDLGTYLFSLYLFLKEGTVQKLSYEGKEYRLALRFKRTYKPYSVYLYKFRFDRYIGTDTPKDFSSIVRVEDPERGVIRDHVRIWMNNPLRYRGDTLYQAGWDEATEAGTILQVVENRGWMAPYLACMIVAVGLLGQFLLHFREFIRKRGGEP